MSPFIPTLADFNATLDASDNVLSDEAVAKILDEAGCDLADECAAIDALCAHAIRPTQVDDLQNAIRLAKRRRNEEKSGV